VVLRDPNTFDLAQQRLRMADDVMIWPVHERGELVYRIEIPKLHRFFRVGHEEYVFISLLDAETTIPQACGLAAAKLGSRAPTAAQAASIARWLLQNDLAYLESDGPPVRQPLAPTENLNQDRTLRLLKRLNPFWIKIPLPNSEHWLNAAAKILRPVFASRAVLLGIFLMVAAAAVLVSRWSEFVSSSASIFHPTNWIWLLAAWVILKLIHELAHAIACERQGGEVGESGIVLILFAPLAYVDVSSCWRLNSRWSRILVAAAGMYVELVIAAVAVLLWTLTDAPQARFLLQNLVFTAGLSTLLFNANVLMRFDGYFILADLIEVPNLYAESAKAIRHIAKRSAIGEETNSSALGGWRRHFVPIYGLAALVWRIVICFSLGIAASTMFAGAGIGITMIGVMIWFGRPLHHLIMFAVDLRRRDPNRFVRGAVVGAAASCFCCWMIFWFPLPTSVTVPAVARYLPETMLRSRASGFVSKIYVADGDLVQEGDLLVELKNRELTSRLQQAEITWKQNEIRLRQAIDRHDAGGRQVLQENQKAVLEQREQLQLQADSLRVVAPRSGRVVARGLEATIATYVEEGDSILVVASESDKELVAVIGQDVIEDVRPLVGNDVRIRSKCFDSVPGKLDRIEPRAIDRLPDPSLAATAGGSLAVQPTTSEEEPDGLRLLEPHFRGRIAIDPNVASHVPAGMRMQVSLGYRTEPIASRIRRTIRRIWHSAHDNAASP
jgi:putative peptide zinc metalloprotease protein